MGSSPTAGAAREFLSSFARALLSDSPEAGEQSLAPQLAGLLEAAGRFVIDVRFTGLVEHGSEAGGVDPELVRAAGLLIVKRVTRVGFTSASSLSEFIALLRAPGTDIFVAAEAAALQGVFISGPAGEVYRGSAATVPATRADERPEGAPTGALDPEESLDLVAFDLIDAHPILPPITRAPSDRAQVQTDPDVPADSMFQFFRSSAGTGRTEDPEQLAASIDSAHSITELAGPLALIPNAIEQALGSHDPSSIAVLLRALGGVLTDDDRPRLFRDEVIQTVKRISSPDLGRIFPTVISSSGLEESEHILLLLPHLGAAGQAAVESLLFGNHDRSVRQRALNVALQSDNLADSVLRLVSGERATNRLNAALALLDESVREVRPAHKLVEIGAQSSSLSVRREAARAAGRIRAFRLLAPLAADDAAEVASAALEALGQTRDAGAVTLIMRLLADGTPESLQLEAVEALGSISAPESVQALASLFRRKRFLPSPRLTRLKLAALTALARMNRPESRSVLQTISESGEKSVAERARELLAV